MARIYKRDRLGRFARVAGVKATVGKRGPVAAYKGFLKGSNKNTARRGGVVPYSRTALHAQTVGINAGHQITKNRRISYGAYVKVERPPTKFEKMVQEKDDAVLDGLAKRISPHSSLAPFVKEGLVNYRRKQIDQLVGDRRQIGGSDATAHIGTTRKRFPVLVVQHGKKADNALIRSRRKNARRQAIWGYNDQMKRSLEGQKAPRPQRRGNSG